MKYCNYDDSQDPSTMFYDDENGDIIGLNNNNQ